MNDAVKTHAKLLVNHSARIESGDMVIIKAPLCAEDLVTSLYSELGDIGARPQVQWYNRRILRAYLQSIDPKDIVTATHSRAAVKEADARIVIQGDENLNELDGIPKNKIQALQRSAQSVLGESPERDVLTQYPATGEAQRAGMSTEEYKKFVWDAIDKDWQEQRREQARLKKRIEEGESVRILADSGTTDLTFSISGMNVVNEHAKGNLPGGEVFTAPVTKSVEGTVQFNFPVQYADTQIDDVYLEFKQGRVVDYSAAANEQALASLIATDEGSHHIGEFGIGMNKDIDCFTHNILFDEKMAGTIHLALGSASDQAVPETTDRNQSSVHIDMIVDLRDDATFLLDGEPILSDGLLWYDDDFSHTDG